MGSQFAPTPMSAYGPSIWAKEGVMLLTNFARESGVTATFTNEIFDSGALGSGRQQNYVDIPLSPDDMGLSLDIVSDRKIAPAMAALCAQFPKAINTWPLILPPSYRFAAREFLHGFSLRVVGTTEPLHMLDYPVEMPVLVVRFDVLWAPA